MPVPAPVAPGPFRSVLRLWALALAVSAGLSAAGERWPRPLPVDPALVTLLLLGLPLLVGLWLLLRWRLPAEPALGTQADHGGESGD
ncbi:hypothetical protein IQ216_07020 [Cyanobium sp. LEGE 06143]|jgi:hypothetical protein|uniref:hypothetical protein n=1 Tax=unclassified Cyanobium TaxID=2627006 RepID=UPI00164607FA|nr:MULTISPECIES: hypothetical protein [unclassified Cyanobium]MBE9154820.1 hypothetical protein [Cyanobium sp. LEGE 06113]MBE9172840.1 hypothetical protein [Cyanobium sp. LEGE 06143]